MRVATLLGEKGIDFSIQCIKSFIQMARFPFELHIFTDGTIENIPITTQSAYLVSITNHSLAERNDFIHQFIKSFPVLAKFRQENVLSYKIIDIPYFMQSPYLYIDSDIFFMRPFSIDNTFTHPVCMHDTKNAYVVSPFEIKPMGKFSIKSCINTGILYLPNGVDFAVLESMAKKLFWKEERMQHAWAEQTLFALLLSNKKEEQLYCFHKEQIAMPFKIKPDRVIAVHYISSYRRLFSKINSIQSSTIQKIELSVLSKRISIISFLVELVNRYINHYGRKILPRLFPLQ